jgi:predicted nucleotidyltransferase
MLPTPFQELNHVLKILVCGLEDSLGKSLIGVYLQGSFALGDYDEHSDVDFIVVLEGSLPSNQVKDLQVLHDRVYHVGLGWAKHLEGSYFPLDILTDFSRRGSELWYLDNGSSSLVHSNHCNTLLVRWVVREYGVILEGPSPKNLIGPVPTGMLREEMFDVLITWGQQILADPAHWSNRFYQGFIVLNYCRMLHDLYNGYPGTKRQGAKWAKQHLDPTWSALIDGAWECRPDPALKVREPADPALYQMTLKFIEVVMDEAAQFMANRE